MSSSKLVSVAIDFGTTYSGYALSFRHDVNDIKTYRWPGGEAKTPTCILFNQNKQFHSFGTQAEDRYSEMVQNGENAADWYFFKHFKLLLKYEVPSSSTMLAAMNGKKMAAIDVFSASIQYLKDHLLKQFQSQFGERDVQWVVTVPAIWEDKARQFMRQAATKAGILDCDLTLTLEPEAASVYCKNEQFNFPAHMKYLLLDCGGGTVDIAVHESCPDGRLKAVYRPTGGLWGGIKVDDAFQSFLVRCCGVEAIQQLTDYEKIQMQRSFENAKKRVTVYGVELFAVTLPMSLRESFDEARAPVFGGAQILRDKLRISYELLRTFSKTPIKKIVDHVKDILSDPKVQPVHAVLMVGGFSESTLLQSAVKDALPTIAVRLVSNSSSAVLRGAVIYGHTPNIIRSRRSAFTYGLSTIRKFINDVHDSSKLVYLDGIANCKDLYIKLITVDDMIEVGKTSVSKYYRPVYADQRSLTLRLYRTTHPSPMYVTDPGCEKIGSLEVHMPDTTGGLDRSVRVTVMFGDSELKVEATDVNTQVKYTAEFDFLSSD